MKRPRSVNAPNLGWSFSRKRSSVALASAWRGAYPRSHERRSRNHDGRCPRCSPQRGPARRRLAGHRLRSTRSSASSRMQGSHGSTPPTDPETRKFRERLRSRRAGQDPPCAEGASLAPLAAFGLASEGYRSRDPGKGGPAARSARCRRQHKSRSGPDQVVYWHDRRPLGTRISYLCGSRQPRAQRCSPRLRQGLR